MRRITSAIALVTIAATTAGAQQMDHTKHAMRMDSTHTMAASCPLHLKTLELTSAQQLVVDSIRGEHQAAMKQLMAKESEHRAGHEGMKMTMPMKMDSAHSAAMEKAMQVSLAGVRSILTDAQRVTFDAAVATHTAEMTAAKAKGDHMACCMECMGGDHTGHAMPKKPDA